MQSIRQPEPAVETATQNHATAPALKSAPIELEMVVLKHVAGGAPKGTWSAQAVAASVDAPKGTW